MGFRFNPVRFVAPQLCGLLSLECVPNGDVCMSECEADDFAPGHFNEIH